jgi:hypothetical protein
MIISHLVIMIISKFSKMIRMALSTLESHFHSIALCYLPHILVGIGIVLILEFV